MKRGYKEKRDVLCLLYDKARIRAEVQRLADQISEDYAGQNLLLLVVLKGAFIFAADLVRRIKVPLEIDFIKVSSYSGTATTGDVVLLKDLETVVTGKDVIIVEDIVDTGLSLSFLQEHLSSKGTKSLRVCALIDKRGRRSSEISLDYAGIICDDRFLVGYGLDLDERYRELPAIYEIKTIPSGGGLNDSSM